MQVPKLKKDLWRPGGIGDAVSGQKMIRVGSKKWPWLPVEKPFSLLNKRLSNFKLRKGVAIGVRVTLRGDSNVNSLDHVLIASALPRILT